MYQNNESLTEYCKNRLNLFRVEAKQIQRQQQITLLSIRLLQSTKKIYIFLASPILKV